LSSHIVDYRVLYKIALLFFASMAYPTIRYYNKLFCPLFSFCPQSTYLFGTGLSSSLEDWVKMTGIKGFLDSKNRSKIGPKTGPELPSKMAKKKKVRTRTKGSF
jgi:hypothetical protein